MTLMAELIPKYLDPELYQVVTAEVAGTTKVRNYLTYPIKVFNLY